MKLKTLDEDVINLFKNINTSDQSVPVVWATEEDENTLKLPIINIHSTSITPSSSYLKVNYEAIILTNKIEDTNNILEQIILNLNEKKDYELKNILRGQVRDYNGKYRSIVSLTVELDK